MNIFKSIVSIICIYIAVLSLCTIGYVMSFKTIIFSGIGIFFYRGIAITFLWGIFAIIFMGVISFLVRKLKLGLRSWAIPGIKDFLLVGCAFVCVNVVIFTHLPVTADRSVTVFMLGTLAAEQNADGLTKDEIREEFINVYVNNYDAFGKRLDEQIFTGTVKQSADGKIRITPEGIKLVKIYRFVCELYGIDDKLVNR